MSYKFKVGDRVRLDCLDENDIEHGLAVGDTGTIQELSTAPFVLFDKTNRTIPMTQTQLRLIEQPKKTAEEIAPILWESYCNVLNEEALAALRQVIDDVENHEEMDFTDIDDITYAFTWSSTMQGEIFWDEVADGEYDKTSVIPSQEPQDKAEEDLGSTATIKPVKSDGGSSDYYKISVKTSHGMADVEVNDLIYALVGGDFDLGNCLKACRRMYLASKGCGKEGVDIAYDARKVAWFCADFQMRFGKEK